MSGRWGRPAVTTATLLLVASLSAAVLASCGVAGGRAERSGGEASTSPATQEDCGPPVETADGGSWECVFADDFDGERLDETRWTVLSSRESGYRNGPECYLGAGSELGADDVRVGDGVLRLTARELDEEVVCPSLNGDFVSRWTGAFVTTYDKFSVTYGRIEVRAAFPDVDLPGVHAALWLWPQSLVHGAEVTGEMDLAEYFSRYPDRAIPFLHYQPAVPDGTNTNNHCLLADPSAMHDYVIEWQPGHVRVLYDGETCLDHDVAPAPPLSGAAPFDQAYTLNLTQALGLGTNAFTADTPLPATTTVDHVRVWQAPTPP